MEKTKSKFFYGWIAVAAAAFATVMMGSCATISNMVTSRLVSEGVISSATQGYCASIISLCSVLFAAPFGIFCKKRGYNVGIAIGGLIAIVGCVVLFFAPPSNILQMICYFPLGFALVASAKIGGPGIANTWFDKNKSIPMSVIIAASSAGAIFSGIMASTMDTYGTKYGYIVLFIACVLAVPVAFFFGKGKPADIGEVRDGRAYREKNNLPMDDTAAAKKGGKDAATTSALLKNGKFWLFSICSLLRMGVFAGCLGYVTLIIVSKGYTPTEAAVAVAALNLASTIARLSVPVLVKGLKMSNMLVNILGHIVLGAGCLLIYFCTGLGILSVAVAMIGIGYGLGYTRRRNGHR